MPRGGHNKKPHALHVLHGTPPGRKPDTAPRPKPIFPEKPPRAALPKDAKHGKKFWRDNAPALARAGVLTEVDIPAWIALCQCWQLLQELEETISKDGLTVQGRQGERVKHPLLPTLAQARNSFRLQCVQFGLDPMARERLSIKTQDAEEDEMERLLTHRRE